MRGIAEALDKIEAALVPTWITISALSISGMDVLNQWYANPAAVAISRESVKPNPIPISR